MNTMHQLFGTWDYMVLGTLAGFTALVLGWQFIRASLRGKVSVA